jgi:hypothetical protein
VRRALVAARAMPAVRGTAGRSHSPAQPRGLDLCRKRSGSLRPAQQAEGGAGAVELGAGPSGAAQTDLLPAERPGGRCPPSAARASDRRVTGQPASAVPWNTCSRCQARARSETSRPSPRATLAVTRDLRYAYGFGDGWERDVRIGERLASVGSGTPRCLDGARLPTRGLRWPARLRAPARGARRPRGPRESRAAGSAGRRVRLRRLRRSRDGRPPRAVRRAHPAAHPALIGKGGPIGARIGLTWPLPSPRSGRLPRDVAVVPFVHV